MSSSILNITFDCADAARVARFWSEVTGWDARAEDTDPGHEEYSAGPETEGGVRLYFVTVPEPKTIKNRIHLDVMPRGDQQREIARLVALGASVAEEQTAGAAWVVMRDPEGNEFCVEPS